MVVKITSPHSLQRVLNYNEKKCQKEQAKCIQAGNYLLQAGQMNFHQKIDRMQELIERNERTKKTNTLHISLNFDPSEKFDTEKLNIIARTYMDKIGFGKQPYLVYEHTDAGHPHIHIVTTNIKADGKRIDTYNIGRNQSEKARKEIEKEFGLVKAEGQKHNPGINPVNVQKVQYGKSETRRSISNVLDHVINQFKYTSIAELNAVLKLYNIAADRGNEDGRIYMQEGLLYRLLDSNGNKTGIPIKASLLHNKPTLKFLKKKFELNEVAREPDKKKLKNSIEWALSKSPNSIKELIDFLHKEKIQAVLRQNKKGSIYGISFVDFRTKAIFNGSDIGKQYSIAGLRERMGEKPVDQAVQIKPSGQKQTKQNHRSIELHPVRTEQETAGNKEELLKDLFDSERNMNRVPGELLKKKQKKRNKNL